MYLSQSVHTILLIVTIRTELDISKTLNYAVMIEAFTFTLNNNLFVFEITRTTYFMFIHHENLELCVCLSLRLLLDFFFLVHS